MSEENCSLCGRAMEPTADACACGAKVDWLQRAPAALRAKLGRSGRGVVGAVVGTVATACTACAAPGTDGGCAADAGCAAFDVGCAARIDAYVAPIGDAACASDCGIDAYQTTDTGITESDCAATNPDAYVEPDAGNDAH